MSGQILRAAARRHPTSGTCGSGSLLDGAAEGLEMRFVDQRMFGGLSVSTGGADLPPEIAHIARDPLDPEFDDDAFVRRVRRSAPPASSASCSTRTSSRVSATSTPTRRCGGPASTATGPADRLTAAQVRELLGQPAR